MDHHLKDFYRQFSDEAPRGNFHSVIVLQQTPELSWSSVKDKIPSLCRGWYELAHLSTIDPIELSLESSLASLPYTQGFYQCMHRVAAPLYEIGTRLTEKKVEARYEARLVYSIEAERWVFCRAWRACEKGTNDLHKA